MSDAANVTNNSGAFDPSELPEIEARLEQLGSALDVTGPSTPFGIVALGFGHRARSLWLGLGHAAAGPSHASMQVILRAIVEMTILLPWLAKDPELHPRLWTAEGERHILAMLRGAPRNAGPRLAAGLAQVGTAERVAEFEQTVEAARRDALTARVRGVGRGGSLVPNLAEMVEAVDTPAVREAYGIAYSYLSGFTHSGARSLGVHVTSDGVVLDDGPPEDTRGDRTLAAIAYAMLLELVSGIAGLGIEEEVGRLRARMLRSSESD